MHISMAIALANKCLKASFPFKPNSPLALDGSISVYQNAIAHSSQLKILHAHTVTTHCLYIPVIQNNTQLQVPVCSRATTCIY